MEGSLFCSPSVGDMVWQACVGGMISGTAHEARAMKAVIGHDPVELDMHQLQASSPTRQSASTLARSIT